MKSGIGLNKEAVTRMQAVAVAIVVVVAAVTGGIYYYLTLPKYPLAPESIKLGGFISYTGPSAIQGYNFERGFILAVEEINAKGGVYVKEYGKKIRLELIKGDDKSVPAEGVVAFKKLIIDDKVDMIVGGSLSGVAFAAGPLTTEYGMPWLLTGTGLRDITNRTDVDTSWIFRYSVLDLDEVPTHFQFLTEVVKPKLAPDRKLRLAIMYHDAAFGVGAYEVAMAVKGNYPGIDVVATVKYKYAAEAYEPQLLLVKVAKPDAVAVFGMFTELANIIVQGLRDVGLTCMFEGISVAEDPKLFDLVKEYGDCIMFDQICSVFAPHSDRLRKFVDDYVKRWGEMPGPHSTRAYDGVYIAANVIERAGTLNKTALKTALRTTDMPEMITSFKDNRIRFTGPKPPYEVSPYLRYYITQFRWNKEKQKMEGYVLWPAELKQKDFAVSPYHKPPSL